MASRSQRIAAATAIATALAIPAEGLRQVAYYDPVGILTVCYGHTGADIIKGKQYSLQECDKYLNDGMRKAIDTVERCIPGLPVNVLAAFGDAVYNMGPTIACDSKESTPRRLLLAGQIAEACRRLPNWNKARIFKVLVPLPGLTKRRNMEMEVCLKDLP